MPYTILNIRKLKLFQPKITKDGISVQDAHDDFPYEEYFHFPALLKSDHSLWEHGSLYLLNKLKAFKQPSSSTLSSQANDLKSFMNFMEDQQLDYLVMCKRKAARPTYQFRFHLQDLIKNNQISERTASRRMNTVINFYRWLANQLKINFQHEAWIESSAIISYENHYGMQQRKLVNTTNLAVKVSPNNDTFNDYLKDGGKLRPLDETEQISLLKALKELKNTEMTLMFMLALSTGARIQTICTLRIKDLETDYNSKDDEVRIIVGSGTLTDTKLDKRAILYIPIWIFIKLQTYSKSPRAVKRRNKNRTYENSPDQYIFLTKGGQPYYMGKNDPSLGIVKSLPKGNAITQFIRSMLLPKLKEMGHQFEFRFHDLRATYGMNLVIINQKKISTGEITYLKLKSFIQERMWHQSYDTTDLYLQYKSNHKFF